MYVCGVWWRFGKIVLPICQVLAIFTGKVLDQVVLHLASYLATRITRRRQYAFYAKRSLVFEVRSSQEVYADTSASGETV
jgi:hypothetical protein